MSEKKSRKSTRHGGGPGGPGGPMMQGTEKAKNFKASIKRLIAYLKPYMVGLIFVLLFAVLSTVFAIYGPKKLGTATDKLGEGIAQMIAYDTIGSMTLSEIEFTDFKLPNGTTLIGSDLKNALPQELSDKPIKNIIDEGTTVETVFSQVMEKVMPQAIQTLMLEGKLTPDDISSLQSMSPDDMQIGNEANQDGDDMFANMPTSYIDMIKAINLTGARPSIDFKAILDVIIFLLILYVISAFFSFLQNFIMAIITQRTVYRMRKEVNAKLNKLPVKYFDTQTHGDILSRVSNDIDNISNTLQQSLGQIITSIVSLIGIIIMMFTISVSLTFAAFVTLPIIAITVAMVAKQSQKHFKNNQARLGDLNGHIEEMYGGHKVVKAYGYEKKSVNDFEKINEKLYVAGWKSQFFSGILFPAINFIGNLGYVAICVIGGILAGNGTITIGGIQAFIVYSKQFNQPIMQVANIMNILQSTAASAERVFEILDETEEIADSPNAVAIETTHGDVSFKNVKFGYSDDNILMNDLSIEAKAGQTIAIVGPTGAGKTTLVNLLMRFYEVQGGEILIDGKNIADIKRSTLREHFGMVLQDTWLFNGTIRENIQYGREDASWDEVFAACKMTYVDRFVRTLPDGYDTVLNEEASNISQGQKQLLTIARAVVANPSILILDEATSSVDTRTEVLIQKAMLKLMQGRTNFVIAHRLSTIKNADLILVMNHGTIIEQGNHEQLMALNGFYTELYNSQFTNRTA